MTPPSNGVSSRRLLPFLLALLLGLPPTACGGGASSRGTDVEPPPGTATSWVLVEVREPEDLDDLVEATGSTVLGPVPGTPYWRVALPPGMSLSQFLDLLDGHVQVISAELDLGVQSPEGDGSTMPAGGSMLSSMLPMQEELLRIGIEAAHARTTGMGVRVAVLDTGILPHEFLAGRVDPDGWDFVGEDDDPTDERDFFDRDADGLVDEAFGHGTFVASLVLAVAPGARIVPFRVLDADGVGNASTLAAAITLAADRGVDVINLSAGMPTQLKVVQHAVKAAQDRGVQVVSSAGNTGRDDVRFPAALSASLAVTAVGPGDVRPPFASYGSEVDLSAPGVDLHGAFPDLPGTAVWSGTSFSAAIVSGAYALLRERFPDERPQDLVRRLEDGAVDVDDVNPSVRGRLGRGRVDLDRATRP